MGTSQKVLTLSTDSSRLYRKLEMDHMSLNTSSDGKEYLKHLIA